MPNLFKKGFSVGETDQITLSSKTHGFEIQNMTPFDLQISSPVEGSYRLPSFSAKPFPAIPGDTINFNLLTSNFNTSVSVQNQYIQIQESPASMQGSVIPLAMIPVYTTTVDVSGGTVEVSSGNLNANITNASIPVSGNLNANVTNAELSVIGNVGVTANTALPITNESGGVIQVGGTINANITNASIPVSGSINATIENASLNSNVTNAIISTGPTVKGTLTTSQTIASGATALLIVPLPAASYFDEVTLVVSDSSGELGYYNFTINQMRYSDSYSSFVTPVNTAFTFSMGYDNATFEKMSDPLTLGGSYLANAITIGVKNTYSASLTSNFTFTLYAKYSSTISQPGEPFATNTTGIPGSANPAWTKVSTQSGVCRRVKVIVYNEGLDFYGWFGEILNGSISVALDLNGTKIIVGDYALGGLTVYDDYLTIDIDLTPGIYITGIWVLPIWPTNYAAYPSTYVDLGITVFMIL